jgi:hypothetical protein
MREKINIIAKKSNDRFDFCINLIDEFNLINVAELGVYRGDFAQKVLNKNQCVEKYTMIDPWRNLTTWNKPANKDNDTFEKFYQETLDKTDFAKEKRIILRGKTTEVISQIPDCAYDLVYIDGDHTLKGISIDLINLWPKVKEKGFIVGDDFLPTIWQHSQKFEPTMVFPFAVYFAEAVNAKIYALPYGQFVIFKQKETEFEFIDLSNGKYSNLELRTQFFKQKFKKKNSLRSIIKKRIPFATKVYAYIRK